MILAGWLFNNVFLFNAYWCFFFFSLLCSLGGALVFDLDFWHFGYTPSLGTGNMTWRSFGRSLSSVLGA